MILKPNSYYKHIVSSMLYYIMKTDDNTVYDIGFVSMLNDNKFKSLNNRICAIEKLEMNNHMNMVEISEADAMLEAI